MRTTSIPLLLLLCVSSFAAEPEPYLKSASSPFYPPLALQARLDGKVTLRFIVTELGETSDVEATSGPKMLQEAAITNIQSWKFWPPSLRLSRKKGSGSHLRFISRADVSSNTDCHR